MSTKSSTGWQLVSLGGVAVPVPAEWTRCNQGLAFGGPTGIVDVRHRSGDVVDPARLAQIRGAYGPNARLLRVQGRAAIRVVFGRGKNAVVLYVLAEPAISMGGAFAKSFDQRECWITYVLPSTVPAGLVDEIFALIGEEDMEMALADHPLSPEGHLSFGPFPVPAAFRPIMDDGSLAELPTIESATRDVDFARGAIVFAGPRSNDRPNARSQSVVFQPLSFVGELDDSGVRRLIPALVAEGTIPRPAEISHLEFFGGGLFASGDVCHYVVASPMLGSYQRFGFIWRDVLGYVWEIAYTVDAATWLTADVFRFWRRASQ